ncbi:MAG: hypothetical protein AABW75_02460 [Nanoarchaeota archaeon]
MNNQALLQASGYIALGLGIGGWSVSKYVMGPFIEKYFSEKEKNLEEVRILGAYITVCDKIAEERAKAMVELGKTDRPAKEISDMIIATLPYPCFSEEPEKE